MSFNKHFSLLLQYYYAHLQIKKLNEEKDKLKKNLKDKNKEVI